MGSKSLSTRLSLNIILIVSVLSIIVLGVVSVSSHQIIESEAKRSAESMLHATIKDVEKDLTEVETATNNAAWWCYAAMDNEVLLYRIASSLVQANPNIVGSAVALADGIHNGDHWYAPYAYEHPTTHQVMTKQLGNADYDYFTMEWYNAVVVDQRPHWSEPYFDEGGGEQRMVTYSVPIIDTTGHFLGVVTADISLNWLQKKMDEIKPYPNSTASLVSGQRRFLATTVAQTVVEADSQLAAERFDNTQLQALEKTLDEGKDSMVDIVLKGERAFVVFGRLDNNWAASISFQYDDVFSKIGQMNLVIAIVGLIGLLLMFVLC